jgi:hypothetical protein
MMLFRYGGYRTTAHKRDWRFEQTGCPNCIYNRASWRIINAIWEIRPSFPPVPVSWHRPPQHLHKRGQPYLYALLRRMENGTTTERDAWTVIGLQGRMIRAEGELKGAIEGNRAMRTEMEFWREQARARDAENARLLRLLEPCWVEGRYLRDELPDGKMLRVLYTAAELREIAEVFGGDDDRI